MASRIRLVILIVSITLLMYLVLQEFACKEPWCSKTSTKSIPSSQEYDTKVFVRILEDIEQMDINCGEKVFYMHRALNELYNKFRDSRLGNGISTFYNKRLAILREIENNRIKMQQIEKRNQILLTKISKLKYASHIHWKANVVGMNDLEALPDRSKDAFNKGDYLRVTPNHEFDIKFKTSFNESHYFRLPVGINGQPLLAFDKGKKQVMENIGNFTLLLFLRGDIQYFSIDGLMRRHGTAGVVYELLHEDADNLIINIFFQPYLQLHQAYKEKVNTLMRPIHIILPVKTADLEAFNVFVKDFMKHDAISDYSCFITILMVGKRNRLENDFHEILSTQSVLTKCFGFRLIPVSASKSNPTFGEVLHLGIKSWDFGDIITMVTEVHHSFKAPLLRHCQLYTRKGSQVYFPIPFGLYNTDLVKMAWEKYSQLSSHKGRWVDTSYDTICMFQSDWLSVMESIVKSMDGKGEDKIEEGFDVFQLVQQRKDLNIVRAPERYLFKKWYNMDCKITLKRAHYKRCMITKFSTLAPLHRLGVYIHT